MQIAWWGSTKTASNQKTLEQSPTFKTMRNFVDFVFFLRNSRSLGNFRRVVKAAQQAVSEASGGHSLCLYYVWARWSSSSPCLPRWYLAKSFLVTNPTTWKEPWWQSSVSRRKPLTCTNSEPLPGLYRLWQPGV